MHLWTHHAELISMKQKQEPAILWLQPRCPAWHASILFQTGSTSSPTHPRMLKNGAPQCHQAQPLQNMTGGLHAQWVKLPGDDDYVKDSVTANGLSTTPALVACQMLHLV